MRVAPARARQVVESAIWVSGALEHAFRAGRLSGCRRVSWAWSTSKPIEVAPRLLDRWRQLRTAGGARASESKSTRANRPSTFSRNWCPMPRRGRSPIAGRHTSVHWTKPSGCIRMAMAECTTTSPALIGRNATPEPSGRVSSSSSP